MSDSQERSGGYLRHVYRLPEEAEEVWAAMLWAAGSLGVQVLPGTEGGSTVRLEAYFPAGEDLSLPEPLPGVEALGSAEVAEEDWLRPWREQARPRAIGRRLWVDPRDEGADEESVPDGRLPLHLPARRAFGTGSHESTSLALELLEDLDLRGKRGLDVGTGSGILAFAALLFGARSVVGTEIDLEVTLVAGENRRRNGLSPAFVTGRLAALEPRPSFDFALVNILPERILPELDLLPPLLCPGAEAIFSGILAELGDTVLAELRRRGLVEHRRLEEGDWVAFHCLFRPGRA